MPDPKYRGLVTCEQVESEPLAERPISIRVSQKAKETWEQLPPTKTNRLRAAIYQIIDEYSKETDGV